MLHLYSIPNECKQCKGSCWDPKSQKKTQENARKLFGKLPNNCVNGTDSVVRCPAARGLL